MYHYYIAARPETVVSMIQMGQLPHQLASWVEPKKIICCKNIEACIPVEQMRYAQTFILDVAFVQPLASKLCSRAGEKQSETESVIVLKIDPVCVQKIFVYSEIARKLLINVFKGNCPKPIEIKPEIYTLSSTLSSQSTLWATSSVTAKFSSPLKRKTYSTSNCSQSNSECKKIQKKEVDLKILERLVTVEEHLQLLRSALCEAQQTVLVTSFDITNETLRSAGLYSLMEQACHRHVKLYFYYHDSYILEPQTKSFFDLQGIRCDLAFTHSKLLVVDDGLIVIGSCNWLSCIDSRYPTSDNGSIVCRGHICKDLKEALWKYLVYYRHQQFGNVEQVEHFSQDSNNEMTQVWEIGQNTTIEYLPTLDQHLGFFQNVFKEAKKQIIICSPFLSSVKNYKMDIDVQLLLNVQQRGVKIFFVCPAQDNKKQGACVSAFIDFLKPFLSQNVFVLFEKNFHCKTIVVDDDLIAEGSFNWLSASRDECSDFHNHESTLVVRGDMAQELIQHFIILEWDNRF